MSSTTPSRPVLSTPLLNTPILIHKEAPARQGTILSSIIALVLSIIGAGTLTVPFAIAQIGWACSAILFITVAIFSILTLNFNMECAVPFAPNCSYSMLCRHTLPSMKHAVDVIVTLGCFGVLCAYLVVIGDLLPDIMHTIYSTHDDAEHDVVTALLYNRKFWISVYMLLFIGPTAYLKFMKSLQYVSYFAIACYAYTMAVIAMYAWDSSSLDACREGETSSRCVGATHIWPSHALNLVKVFPFYVQIFTCHFNVFSICNELQNGSLLRLNIVGCSAIVVALLMYAVIGYGAYWTYGDSIDGNIILKYPHSNSLLVLRLCLSIAIAIGYPVILQSPRKCLASLWFQKHAIEELSAVQFYGMTTVLLLASFAIAMVTDDITVVFGMVGSTATICVAFILPAVFYYNLAVNKQTLHYTQCKKYFSLLCIAGGAILIPLCVTMQFIDV